MDQPLSLPASSWAEFVVYEPDDSTLGLAVREAGCEARGVFPPDGEGMAAILNRDSLLRQLVRELARRERVRRTGEEPEDLDAAELLPASRAAFEDLCDRKAVPDDGELLRLLLGFHS